MNAVQLKDSILQYAMQGKLIDVIEDLSFKEDWNKEVLNNKKAAYISEDEVPFDIPNTWVWARVGDLGVVQTGNTPSTSNIEYYNEKFIPFIKPGDFIEGTLDYDNEYLSKKGAEKARLIEANSILMVCIGGSRGKCAYNDRQVACNQQINTLTVNSNLISIHYIFYIMQSRYFQNLMIEKSTGTATPIVNKTNWSNFIVPVAPLEEQIEIVEKINEIFLKIEDYQNSYQNLQVLNNGFPSDLEKSILQYAMQGKLVEQNLNDEPTQLIIEKIHLEKEKLIKEKVIKIEKPLPSISEEEIPFDIPSTWEWVRLGDIIHFISGYAYKSNAYVSDSNCQIIRIGNVKRNRLLLDVKPIFISEELAKQTEAYKIKENDILVTMTGTKGKKDYFYTCLVNPSDVKSDENLYLNQRVGCIRPLIEEMSQFIIYLLQSSLILDVVFEKETGTANQGNIGIEAIKKLVIPLPPLEEQKRIVKAIEKMMRIKDKLIQ